jgi:hypothetical protein
MKTISQKTNNTWMCGAIGFALLLLGIFPRLAEAQTNTFPSSGKTRLRGINLGKFH